MSKTPEAWHERHVITVEVQVSSIRGENTGIETLVIDSNNLSRLSQDLEAFFSSLFGEEVWHVSISSEKTTLSPYADKI